MDDDRHVQEKPGPHQDDGVEQQWEPDSLQLSVKVKVTALVCILFFPRTSFIVECAAPIHPKTLFPTSRKHVLRQFPSTVKKHLEGQSRRHQQLAIRRHLVIGPPHQRRPARLLRHSDRLLWSRALWIGFVDFCCRRFGCTRRRRGTHVFPFVSGLPSVRDRLELMNALPSLDRS